jgi:hypothetical protein
MVGTIEHYTRYFMEDLGGIAMTPLEFHALATRQDGTAANAPTGRSPKGKFAEVPAR